MDDALLFLASPKVDHITLKRQAVLSQLAQERERKDNPTYLDLDLACLLQGLLLDEGDLYAVEKGRRYPVSICRRSLLLQRALLLWSS